MKKTLLILAALLAGASASAATISRNADGSATFSENDAAGAIEVTFKKCMANELYTFYQVRLDGKLVNSAQYSDNIGPFLLTNYGWVGGNHLSDSNKKTAKTIDVSVAVDGEALDTGTRQGSVMEVNVVNELYLPDGSVFAVEKVAYMVAGNSIEVRAEHEYKVSEAVKVDRYYGMQSMFDGETEILAPGSKKSNKWLTVIPGGSANAINIKSYEAPKFSVFVEHSAKGYQASYMAREGLGTRSKVGAEDVVYIGNSYEKSYHKTIGGAKVNPGDVTTWHGIYSWFSAPKQDTFATGADNPVFVYDAYANGTPVTISVGTSGLAEVQTESGFADATAAACEAVYFDLRGMRLAAPQPGQICLRTQGSAVEKILY